MLRWQQIAVPLATNASATPRTPESARFRLDRARPHARMPGRAARPSEYVQLTATPARADPSPPSATKVAQAPPSSVALVAAADPAGAREPVSAPDPRTRSSLEALGRGVGSRIPWAELLKRVYDVDALACPCGGRLRFIALILESDVARRILDSLGLDSASPPIARARSPDFADYSPSAG